MKHAFVVALALGIGFFFGLLVRPYPVKAQVSGVRITDEMVVRHVRVKNDSNQNVFIPFLTRKDAEGWSLGGIVYARSPDCDPDQAPEQITLRNWTKAHEPKLWRDPATGKRYAVGSECFNDINGDPVRGYWVGIRTR